MDRDTINTCYRFTFVRFSLATLMCVFWFFAAPAVRAAAADGTTAPPASSSTAKPASANLGSVQVTGVKQLVRTLQIVKVAIDRPFSDSPDQADVVVCRIVHDHGELGVEGRMGALLECGTNSWFTFRRDRCQENQNSADCAAMGSTTSAYRRKGAWHSVRALSLTEVKALRSLLKKLPAPDSQQKILVQMDSSKK